MANADSKSATAINKVVKTERYYTVGYAPQNGKLDPPPSVNLKGQWLKEAGFETGFTFTIKILNGCLVLIVDDKNTLAIKQQNREHHNQLSEIKSKMRALIQ